LLINTTLVQQHISQPVLYLLLHIMDQIQEYLSVQDGVSLPSYRGDIINGPEFTPEARVPDPTRLVKAYNQSAATMNLLRAFTTGGYAGLDRVSQWNLDFMVNTPKGARYQEVAARVDESLQFMRVRFFTFCALTAASSRWRVLIMYPL
jgi:3-deoxy-D-arabino-heptulosonate 7-phosphate (DAHP) synthase class II